MSFNYLLNSGLAYQAQAAAAKSLTNDCCTDTNTLAIVIALCGCCVVLAICIRCILVPDKLTYQDFRSTVLLVVFAIILFVIAGTVGGFAPAFSQL